MKHPFADLLKKSTAELSQMLKKARAATVSARLAHFGGSAADSTTYKKARRQVARISTALRQIASSTPPAAPSSPSSSKS